MVGGRKTFSLKRDNYLITVTKVTKVTVSCLPTGRPVYRQVDLSTDR